MSGSSLDSKLTEGRDQMEKGHYESADTRDSDSGIRALTEEFLEFAGNTECQEDDHPVFFWLADLISKALAQDIPEGADGQQVLDGVVRVLQSHPELEKNLFEGVNALYLGRVIQALYFRGNNYLHLDLQEFAGKQCTDLHYLHGEPDAQMVLHIGGDIDSIENVRDCALNLGGEVGCIDYAEDCTFHLYGWGGVMIKEHVSGCDFYLHSFDEKGFKKKMHVPEGNRYFVKTEGGGWKEMVSHKPLQEKMPSLPEESDPIYGVPP